MKNKMKIYYDPEGDFLEVRFGEVRPSYYENIGDDMFERRDEKTNKITGYKFFNVKKRKEKIPLDVEVDLNSLAIC
ncbi:hypothetical protein GF327_10335 [Candidatus Woesearchaeota archaeon]|nr:hypothetical protein [Candidatus Woesearchaeota archaeon]